MVPPVKNFIFRVVILIFAFCILNFNCYAESHNYIRVAILQDASAFNLKINGFYEIQDAGTQEVLYRGKVLKTTVTNYSGSILIGKVNSPAGEIFIKADDPEAIIINGRRFRGNIQLIKKGNSRLTVINYIDSEDYIKGILYHEVSHYWPKEALKAQAVACRTYAFYQKQENASRDFDVTSDIYSQVYGGRTSERYRTNKAVDAVKSEVLTYEGKIFPAYYHATCSGSTEDAALLWDIDIPPLKGVICNFCKESPHFNWHLVLSQDKINDALVKSGYAGFKEIKNIAITDRDTSGRIKGLKITTDKKEINISAKDFRNIIGPNLIRSTNFNAQAVNGDIVFEGFGWGHGVGMCQWGAYFMAKQGYDYKQILQFYYSGSVLGNIPE